MRNISYRTWIARSLARALLADADKPGGTRFAALQARAVAALGENPVWLAAVIEPLAALPPLRWQMMDLDRLTQRIVTPPQARRVPAPTRDARQDEEDGADPEDSVGDDLPTQPGLSFADGDIPHIRRLILRPAKMRPRPLGLHACTPARLQFTRSAHRQRPRPVAGPDPQSPAVVEPRDPPGRRPLPL